MAIRILTFSITPISLSLTLLMISSIALSQDNQEKTGFIDRNHEAISNRIIDIANNIDSYFYKNNEEQINLQNRSYILLEYFSAFEKGGERDDKFRLRGKLDLPNTKRHLKIFFDSDDDENTTLDEEVLASRENNRNESSSLGIESTQRLLKNWKRKFRLGIRLNSNPDTYAKLTFSRKDDLHAAWYATTRQELKYSHREGWSSGFNIDFIRSINVLSKLYFTTKIYYRNETDFFELAQIASIYTDLGNNQTVKYKVGVLGTSGKSPETTDYFFGINYRRPVYRPWLFLSLNPEFIFPKEDNFKLNPTFTLKLQVVFTSNQD